MRGGILLRDYLSPLRWRSRVYSLSFGICWEAIRMPSRWKREYQFGLVDGDFEGEARLEAPGYSRRMEYRACKEVVAETLDFLLDTPVCPGQLSRRPADNEPFAWLEMRTREASFCARTFSAGETSSEWEASLNGRAFLLTSVRPSLAIRMVEPSDIRLDFLKVIEAAHKAAAEDRDRPAA